MSEPEKDCLECRFIAKGYIEIVGQDYKQFFQGCVRFDSEKKASKIIIYQGSKARQAQRCEYFRWANRE